MARGGDFGPGPYGAIIAACVECGHPLQDHVTGSNVLRSTHLHCLVCQCVTRREAKQLTMGDKP